jgi:exopolyphosphatase / guanosine-5'-triphosphate,3'-diphosphate pyrophosphatase
MRARSKDSVRSHRQDELVPVGVIDVGSNTVRLKVADDGEELVSAREMLRLGAEVEQHGRIRDDKLAETVEVVRRFAGLARDHGATELELLITSPGRQAENGGELRAALADAGVCDARILSSAEEGLLAFSGALTVADPPPARLVAVVDVGGGSAQVVIGSRRRGPIWARSIDIGSQRLTSRLLGGDPPGLEALGEARAEVQRYLEDFDPPLPRVTLAVGGSARALRRVAGTRLDPEELDRVLELLAATPSERLVDDYGVDPDRARTMAAGTLILSEIQRRLDTPLKVVRAGLREGALLELNDRRAAA